MERNLRRKNCTESKEKTLTLWKLLRCCKMESLNLLLLTVVAVVAATAAAVAAAKGCELWLEGELKRLLHLPQQTLRFTAVLRIRVPMFLGLPDPAPDPSVIKQK